MTTLKKPNIAFVFIAKIFGFFVFNLYYRLHIKKKYNFPRKGPFFVVSNHTSFFDSIFIGYISSVPLYYIAKEELFRNKIFAFIIRQCGAVPISRKKSGGAGLIKAINILNLGGSILFFPEGTRSMDNKMRPAKVGTGFIISHSKGVPVVPVFIKGLRGSRKKETIFLRPKNIFITIGKPMLFNSGSYEEISSRVMEEIKKLSFF